MDVRIAQPLGYSELGGRSNNEDSIFPDPQFTSPLQRWFLVCDGVGGADRGEIASQLAITSFNSFLEQQPVDVPTDVYIQKAVAYVEDQFNAYFRENPKAMGMATTMTLLYLHEAGATVAHIGDSRVYQIRAGTVIWRTDDHSYVNELVKAGVLTPSEAHQHPERNIITRALQGGEKRVQASVQLLNDLRSGDYFFLCSDGVLERVSDELLEGTLYHNTDSNEQKIAKLRNYSVGNTRDNFTAYLIQIDQVAGAVDPVYQVTAPVYERAETDVDSDESITLINIPVPEAFSQEPVPVPVPIGQDKLPSYTEPETATQPDTATAPVSASTNSTSKRIRERPVTPMPARRAVNVWSILLFALLGISVGVGGVVAWQYFTTDKRVANRPSRPNKQPTALTSKPHTTNAIGAVIGSTAHSTEPVPSPDQTNVDASSKPTSSTAIQGDNNPASDKEAGSTKESTPVSTRYETVRTVDNQLLVVKDTRTNLVGLRKTNGHWTTDPVYGAIGSFKNGVAEVKTLRGLERFLNKEGKEFKSRSDYTDGVATLIGADGTKSYLSKNGNWLDEVKTLSNGKIAVRRKNLWGYLNSQGQLAIRLQYDKAESFGKDGTALVTMNGRPCRINAAGRVVVSDGDAKTMDKKGNTKKAISMSKV